MVACAALISWYKTLEERKLRLQPRLADADRPGGGS
jgi:hypothetical protein